MIATSLSIALIVLHSEGLLNMVKNDTVLIRTET